MNEPSAIDRFLNPDPMDVGCEETFALIDLYVELTLAGAEPELIYPEIAVHLLNCPPCAEDFQGLLAAVGGSPG